MYLTRMRLNPTRVTTKRLVASPQVTHALVEGSFPPDSHQTGRVLWRLDRASHELDLYVVSPTRPDLTGLVEQCGWPTQGTWETKEYDPFLGRLEGGQRWRFRLTANPTRSEPTGPGRRGRLRPLRTVAQQEQWLLDRAERHGFAIPTTSIGARELVVTARGASDFVRRSPDGATTRRDNVEITKATYEGVLEVLDPQALRAALTGGIGRAKGYGCGLMTLARWP